MIDPAKTYRTREGLEVRIYAVDGGGRWPVHGAIKDADGWKAENWKLTGKAYDSTSRPDDLIEIKPKNVRWVNIYPSSHMTNHTTRAEADREKHISRLACVRVEFEEGEGL